MKGKFAHKYLTAKNNHPISHCTPADATPLADALSTPAHPSTLSPYVSSTFEDVAGDRIYDLLGYSSLVTEFSADYVCICDLDTFEVLYLNKVGRDTFGITNWDQIADKKCYDLFYCETKQCEFCPQAILRANPNATYQHSAVLPSTNQRYMFSDRYLYYNGRHLVMQIAADITELHEERNQLDQQLLLQRALFSCVKTLTENEDLQSAINSLLRTVCEYYGADRGYICEFSADRTVVNNTYEWCIEGVSSEMDNLQNVPSNTVDDWVDKFNECGSFSIALLSVDRGEDSPDYRILLDQGIESLMTAPFMDGDEVLGFLGVDNPTLHVDDFDLLSSVSNFAQNDIVKRRMSAEITRRSNEDTLTNTHNRNKYMRKLEKLETTPQSSVGIVYVDVNGLKFANDMYGHTYGDSLLIAVSHLISSVFENCVYRIGGDEFVVIIPNIAHDEFTFRVTQLHRLIAMSGQVSASVGSAWGGQGHDVQTLVKDADEAMYLDKQKYYDSCDHPRHNFHSGLAKTLLDDIAAGRYHVFLQPKVNLETGILYGAEALVRRIEEDGRVVTPNSFLPLFESNGIIRHIDFFVLETVCILLKDLQGNNAVPTTIAVNFSRVTLQEYNVVAEITSICTRHDIDPALITIEVTETSSILKSKDLVHLIQSIKNAGFGISLDDYGSEYSNISTISNVVFDEIKLDRSIISELESNEKARTIVSHTVNMIKELNVFKLVAEGIETSQELEILKSFGCGYGQGYYFSRPVPISAFLSTHFPDVHTEHDYE